LLQEARSENELPALVMLHLFQRQACPPDSLHAPLLAAYKMGQPTTTQTTTTATIPTTATPTTTIYASAKTHFITRQIKPKANDNNKRLTKSNGNLEPKVLHYLS